MDGKVSLATPVIEEVFAKPKTISRLAKTVIQYRTTVTANCLVLISKYFVILRNLRHFAFCILSVFCKKVKSNIIQ